MTAAAFGQVFSDLSGVCFGGTVEAIAAKLGLPSAGFTTAQVELGVVRFVGTLGRAVGVVSGCLLGMTSLLFMDLEKTEAKKRQQELGNVVAAISTALEKTLRCRAKVYFFDPEAGEIFRARVDGQRSHIQQLDLSEPSDQIRSPLSFVIREGKAINVRDCQSQTRFDCGNGAQTALYYPIFDDSDSTVIGVLVVTNRMVLQSGSCAGDATQVETLNQDGSTSISLEELAPTHLFGKEVLINPDGLQNNNFWDKVGKAFGMKISVQAATNPSASANPSSVIPEHDEDEHQIPGGLRVVPFRRQDEQVVKLASHNLSICIAFATNQKGGEARPKRAVDAPFVIEDLSVSAAASSAAQESGHPLVSGDVDVDALATSKSFQSVGRPSEKDEATAVSEKTPPKKVSRIRQLLSNQQQGATQQSHAEGGHAANPGLFASFLALISTHGATTSSHQQTASGSTANGNATANGSGTPPVFAPHHMRTFSSPIQQQAQNGQFAPHDSHHPLNADSDLPLSMQPPLLTRQPTVIFSTARPSDEIPPDFVRLPDILISSPSSVASPSPDQKPKARGGSPSTQVSFVLPGPAVDDDIASGIIAANSPSSQVNTASPAAATMARPRASATAKLLREAFINNTGPDRRAKTSPQVSSSANPDKVANTPVSSASHPSASPDVDVVVVTPNAPRLSVAPPTFPSQVPSNFLPTPLAAAGATPGGANPTGGAPSSSSGFAARSSSANLPGLTPIVHPNPTPRTSFTGLSPMAFPQTAPDLASNESLNLPLASSVSSISGNILQLPSSISASSISSGRGAGASPPMTVLAAANDFAIKRRNSLPETSSPPSRSPQSIPLAHHPLIDLDLHATPFHRINLLAPSSVSASPAARPTSIVTAQPVRQMVDTAVSPAFPSRTLSPSANSVIDNGPPAVSAETHPNFNDANLSLSRHQGAVRGHTRSHSAISSYAPRDDDEVEGRSHRRDISTGSVLFHHSATPTITEINANFQNTAANINQNKMAINSHAPHFSPRQNNIALSAPSHNILNDSANNNGIHQQQNTKNTSREPVVLNRAANDSQFTTPIMGSRPSFSPLVSPSSDSSQSRKSRADPKSNSQ